MPPQSSTVETHLLPEEPTADDLAELQVVVQQAPPMPPQSQTVEIHLLPAEPTADDLAELQMGFTGMSLTGKRAHSDAVMEGLAQGLGNLQIGCGGFRIGGNLIKDLRGKHPRLLEPPTVDLNPFAHSGAIVPISEITWGEIDARAMFPNGRVSDLFGHLHFLKTLGRKWGSYELFSHANFHRHYMQATTEATADIATLFMRHEGLRGLCPEVMLHVQPRAG
jgi:hypothetical protein